MTPLIDYSASDSARAAILAIGRTEDVRFSPDNRLLALAGFTRNCLLILKVQVSKGKDRPQVDIGDFMQLTSDCIGKAHGVDFIDNRTLAVANRDGLVSIIEIPTGAPAGRSLAVRAIRQIRGGLFTRLKSPGSVAVTQEADGRISLLVCNNYAHRVTKHVLDPRRAYAPRSNRVLMSQGLVIPDGIAISHDGKWIAVSSHGTEDVKIYAASGPAGAKARPAGVLLGANYPHGLRFSADDRHVIVADAGSPVLRVYESDGSWAGDRQPARVAKVLDEATFARGHFNKEEGGPKGIDIDRTGAVVAITCEEQPLAFYAFDAVVATKAREAAPTA